ncbi:type III secretion system export apparatus subunit SctV [Candidatus Neptunochlamydia vexilliferae]|uniref:Low calcium response locus protein D n=1 Tax=Candidatus Neptunichlamydia vexilliferae TaxID=1651774 RepID=A0ABS0AX42_9BACT|nr:type III secretion system export apparatus subunit SctV [Candidatus Neptunochlamydia vexilliferae]MBF5058539.1 Low calcium response locus protein D [Candidatus Neptunochlamydia vexilliferae]
MALADFLGGRKISDLLNRSSDVVLAAFVITIILMIIVPLPHAILDMLIGINLSVSVCLLMVSLYIQKAVHLSIFPSILLITTLFRLGIEIAATRQILLYADAGKIISAFGNLVVGGNFVVGGVIFLIITIVQFIVVTKGAERVAEVAARFTLDAMPGKQMSIDADLRSGTLDANQAREMRLALQKESQLYGAMDGALKFVKGDVIAGIVIAVINIVGGLVIGMVMHGLTAMESAKTYTLLSIGEGLVTQIPSLMISLTAGIVTTRVSSEKKGTNLGRDISSQIFSHSKGLILAGFVTFGMAWLKGFPTTVFLILTAVFSSVGIRNHLKEKKRATKTAAGTIGPTSVETDVEGHTVVGGGLDDYALTLPVIMEMGKSLSGLIRKEKGGTTFIDEMIPKMRHALYQDLGVRFPGVHVRTDSTTLDGNEYAIFLNEVPTVRGRIMDHAVLTNETEETLKRYNLPFTTSKNAVGQAALWVESRYIEVLKKAGIKYWKPLDVMVLHLSQFYKNYAAEFIGIQEVRAILEFVEKAFPDLVKEVTRLVPLQKLTEIFRRLVQEQVSIKDLRTILEALSEWAQTEKDTVLLTEYVRSSLKRYISYKYSLGQTTLAVYLLDPEIEDMIRGAIKQTSGGSYLALDPDSVQLILHAMRGVIVPTPPGGQPPVLLTAIDVRRFARKLIEGDFPDLPVVSYQEIVPEVRIQPLGRIQLT